MPFVVKVARTVFSSLWLAPASGQWSYSLGPRKDAIVFPTQAEAQDAVVKANKTFRPIGKTFLVEPADESP
jgi:hypothetical protein